MISRAAIEAGAQRCYEQFHDGMIGDTEQPWARLPKYFREQLIDSFAAGVSAALAAEGMALVPTSLLNLISSGADFESDQDGPYHQLRAMLKAAGASDADK